MSPALFEHRSATTSRIDPYARDRSRKERTTSGVRARWYGATVKPLRPHPEGTELDVWVVPGASRTEITGVHDGAVRIRVAAPPEGGKANDAVRRLLAKTAGCRVRLLRGPTSRRKVFLLEGVDPDEAIERLPVPNGAS